MEHKNYFTVTIPKGRRLNFRMLAKVYGSLMTYDYTNPAVAAKNLSRAGGFLIISFIKINTND